jgi:hypothetical protein
MMVSHATASMVAARSLSWDSEYPMAGSARCTQGFRLNVSIKLPCAADAMLDTPKPTFDSP